MTISNVRLSTNETDGIQMIYPDLIQTLLVENGGLNLVL